MGNRLTTFQNLLEQQLRATQSLLVHLVRIEEILGDIRDGRVMAIPEDTVRISRNLSTIEEADSDLDTIRSSSSSFLEEAIV